VTKSSFLRAADLLVYPKPERCPAYFHSRAALTPGGHWSPSPKGNFCPTPPTPLSRFFKPTPPWLNPSFSRVLSRPGLFAAQRVAKSFFQRNALNYSRCEQHQTLRGPSPRLHLSVPLCPPSQRPLPRNAKSCFILLPLIISPKLGSSTRDLYRFFLHQQISGERSREALFGVSFCLWSLQDCWIWRSQAVGGHELGVRTNTLFFRSCF